MNYLRSTLDKTYDCSYCAILIESAQRLRAQKLKWNLA